jgi:hypothetical protein
VRKRPAEHLAKGADAAPFQGLEHLGELAGDRHRLSERCGQGIVGLIDLEVVRVPFDRQPVVSGLCVGEDIGEAGVVVPAAHPPRELLVAADPPAVLGRTGHPPSEATHHRRRLG